jgi:hypothetical protein
MVDQQHAVPAQAGHPAPPPTGDKAQQKAADRARLAKIKPEAAALEAEITQIEARLGITAGMVPAGGGGGVGNLPTSFISAEMVAAGAAPTIVDVPHATQAGGVLSCTQGNWNGEPDSKTYQWQREGVNVAGADGANYTTAPSDVGSSFACVVTAINSGGQASSTSNAVVVAGGATGATGATGAAAR